MVTDYGYVGTYAIPLHAHLPPICPQEPWKTQRRMLTGRDRSRVKFSFCACELGLGRELNPATVEYIQYVVYSRSTDRIRDSIDGIRTIAGLDTRIL
jgi:hypothetical protein